MAASALLLLTYTAIRAVRVPITWDESFTYVEHVLPTYFFPHDFGSMGANHHLLNVWAMILSTGLFGNAEWALRLPCLLAHVLYLYATARIALRARNGWLALALFALLNVHPYLLDFFSLARGYALGIGCMMWSLWQATRYLTEGQRTPHLVAAMVGAVLAAMGNLVLLNYLLALVAVLGAGWLIGWKWEAFVVPRRQVVAMIAFLLGGLALLLPIALAMRTGGALYYGCDTWWGCTFKLLGERLLYDRPYGWDPVMVMGVAIACMAFLCGGAYWSIRRRGDLRRAWPMLFGMGVLLACVASFSLQQVVFGTPLPRTRTALFLLPLALFPVVSGLAAALPKQKWTTWVAWACCLPLLIHQAKSANFTYALEWRQSGEIVRMLDLVEEDHRSRLAHLPVIVVSLSMESRGSLPYYLIRKKLQWLVEHPLEGTVINSNYYIVDEYDRYRVDTLHWELLYDSAPTGTRLYRDQRWQGIPREVHHELLDFEGESVPGRTRERKVSGQYAIRFDADSRPIIVISWVVADTLDRPDLQVRATAMIAQPDRTNWVTLLVRVKRNGKQIAYSDVNSATQMRHFDQWNPVTLPLYLAPPLLPGDTVRVETGALTDDTIMYLDDLECWVLE